MARIRRQEGPRVGRSSGQVRQVTAPVQIASQVSRNVSDGSEYIAAARRDASRSNIVDSVEKLSDTVFKGIRDRRAREGEEQERRALKAQKQAEQRESFRVETEYQEMQNRLIEQSRVDMDEIQSDGAGFHDEFMRNRVHQEHEQFMASVPERLRDKYALRTTQDRGKWSQNVAKIERDYTHKWQAAKIQSFGDRGLSSVYASPNQTDNVIDSYNQQVDNSNLPAVVKFELKEKYRSQATLIRHKREMSDNPALASLTDKAGITPAYLEKVIGKESGGNPNAKNPNSSATGLGQFIKPTWAEFMKDRHPEIKGDIQKLRHDPNLSREAIIWYAEKNSQKLEKAGLPVNDATLYLAHFVGPGKAIAVLKAQNDVPIEQILGSDIMKANPFLKGMRAGDLVNWASRKMTGTNAGLSFAAMAELRNHAGRVVREDIAAQKVKYAEYKGSMHLAIRSGHVDSEQRIMDDSFLSDADKATAVNMWQTENKERIKKRQLREALQDEKKLWSPSSPEDKQALDLAVEDSGMLDKIQDGDVAATAELVSLTKDKGMLAPAAKSTVKAMIDSSDAEMVQNGYDAIDQLYQADTLVAIRDLGEKTIERYQTYKALEGRLKPDELLRTVRTPSDAIEEGLRNRRLKEADEILKEYELGNLLNDLDTSILPFTEPDAPILEAGRAAILQDYRSIFKARFKVTGDEDIARKDALELVRSQWTETVANRGALMKYPPEMALPQVDGSHDWIRDQLLTDTAALIQQSSLEKSFWEGSEVGIVATGKTIRQINQGENPSYQIMVRYGDGRYEVLRDEGNKIATITFDPTEYQKKAVAKWKNKDAERQRANDKLRRAKKSVEELQSRVKMNKLKLGEWGAYAN